MNIERKNIDTLNAELEIQFIPSDYADRVEASIKKVRKTMQIPGFRPGHVPSSLVKKKYGKSILAEELNQMIQEHLYKYIAEHKLEILGSPIPTAENDSVGDWENPSDFKFTYQIGFAPELNIQLDASLSFEYTRALVDDKLIERQMKDMARRYGKMSDPEVSEAEDMLMVELTPQSSEGEAKTSKSTVSIEYIKDDSTKQRLIGLKKDDVISVNPHHLSDNHEDLAKMLGLTHAELHHISGDYSMKVTEIKRLEPHAIDQELFDKIYGPDEVTSEEAMRERVRQELDKAFGRDADFLLKKVFARQITEQINPALPDAFLKRYIAISNEKPLTPEMIEQDYPLYAAQLRWELIEGKIIRQFELKVTADDAMSHVKQVLASRYAQYGLPMEDEMLTEFAKKTLSNKEEAKNVYDFLYEEKIIALVKEKCSLQENYLPYEEFIHKVQHS
ncbi:MAG: trigger factor [Flavobacteriales bacterium]